MAACELFFFFFFLGGGVGARGVYAREKGIIIPEATK